MIVNCIITLSWRFTRQLTSYFCEDGAPFLPRGVTIQVYPRIIRQQNLGVLNNRQKVLKLTTQSRYIGIAQNFASRASLQQADLIIEKCFAWRSGLPSFEGWPLAQAKMAVFGQIVVIWVFDTQNKLRNLKQRQNKFVGLFEKRNSKLMELRCYTAQLGKQNLPKQANC